MSIIRSLIDKLNKSADEWDGTSMFELARMEARMCREAADTIWELRNDLQRANAENAKLRELVAELYQCSRQCGCDRCGYKDGCAMFDRMRELGEEAGDE